MEQYDSIIVGGGIAGLQAAIQLGRYEHRVLVIDAVLAGLPYAKVITTF